MLDLEQGYEKEAVQWKATPLETIRFVYILPSHVQVSTACQRRG